MINDHNQYLFKGKRGLWYRNEYFVLEWIFIFWYKFKVNFVMCVFLLLFKYCVYTDNSQNLVKWVSFSRYTEIYLR